MKSSIGSVMRCLGRVAVTTLVMTTANAEPGVPVLRYDPPINFYRSASTPPEDYSANEFNAAFQVYPFRPFNGNIEQTFRKTLLREWIDPRYQETIVAAQPEFRLGSIRGAQLVLTARFAENIAGLAKPRMRMVIVADGAAAVVDASASSEATWQRALLSLNAMSASMRVDAEAASPAMTEGPGARGRAVAGLYMGTKPKYVVDLNRPVGYGSQVPALHYYLFSADGRAYRAYDDLPLPGGDASRFDFDAAQRADPVNSGRYTITGGKMFIQMGGQPVETITTAAPVGGRMTINTVVYVRQ
jgi:hypothetical protein